MNIYIDNNYIGIEKGTIEQPFKNIPKLEANNDYFIKANSVFNNVNTISVSVNCSISKYGIGLNPLIQLATPFTRSIVFTNSICKVTNIDFKIQSAVKGTGNIGIFGNSDVVLDNCNITGGNPAINIYQAKEVTLIDCIVNGACYDSIFGNYIEELSIYGCYFGKSFERDIAATTAEQANLEASIDLVHVEHCKKLTVVDSTFEHNIGKYCIINNSSGGEYSYSEMTIVDCNFEGNTNEGLLFPAVAYTTIDTCNFEGGKRWIHTSGTNLRCTNSTFKGSKEQGIFCNSQTQEFINCEFEATKVFGSPQPKQNYCKVNGIGVLIDNVINEPYDIPVYVDPVKALAKLQIEYNEIVVQYKEQQDTIARKQVELSDMGIKLDYSEKFKTVTYAGLNNKYQTKASILKQLNALQL